MEKYPECEKMRAVREKSQAIGEFLEWLQKYYVIGYYEDDILLPKVINIERTLADFFGIDLDKVEKEKRMMIEELA